MTDEGAIPGFIAVIPAGGVGSRLWPLSRAEAPKFLHDLTGSGQSLLADTWDRVLPLAGPERVVVVTGTAHEAAVREELPELVGDNILLELSPRDSAAAIGLAAAIVERRSPGAIIGSFSADHIIRDDAAFRSAVREAVAVAETGLIAAIGIAPSTPAVGYGYIQATEPLEVPAAPHAAAVRSFTEKPNRATARRYLDSGRYLWNAGMYVARAALILEWIQRSRPALAEGLDEIAAAWDGPDRESVVERVWPELEKVAIDYVVAEPAAAAGAMAVVRGEFDWDDVGDFAAISRLRAQEGTGELHVFGGPRPNVVADGATGLVYAQTGRVISLIGIKDIVVVDTEDALLVTTTEHAQQVKSIVDALRLSGRGDVL